MALFLTSLVAACSSPATRAGEPVDPVEAAERAVPNIIILLADDMGWNDVGFHGSEIRTPNLDRLAAEGVVLDRFYVQPTCSPTRSALMTGKAAFRLGVFAPLSKNNATGLPISETLLPEYLKTAGYSTALTGKWHLGARHRAYLPNQRGFDYFYGNLTGGIGYWDHVHGGGYDLQRNGVAARDSGYITDLIGHDARRVIRSRKANQPFFLYVAFNAPHLPNEAPEQAIAQYGPIDRQDRRVHAAMVSELDRQVGQILDTLEDEGILDNTLIWFMSDNGGLIEAPQSVRNMTDAERRAHLETQYGVPVSQRFLDFVRINQTEGGSDNGPLKGGKGTVWEGGTRVPSVVYWKGTLAPGHRPDMVTVQDVLPTLLSVAGLAKPAAPIDGRDVWPLIQSGATPDERAYVVQARHGGLDLALYQYPWKLVQPSTGAAMLFDVEADPSESRDLAADYPDILAALQKVLTDFPRGRDVAEPFDRIMQDPDFFGGEEDRVPWADQVVDD
ncbi:arylsulfatase B [Hyphomonas johnsonii]|uniref:Twin-arginine translocation pathway signal n=1 Tax=Hyphomonas johnsonii MHS-2 TaxID=1280950 RepID=A0A059FBD4_9PROT|nr:arylsulfatase [Hyphomonas johnsonii]KCZ87920.1 twin-arginine translocation pathway signal [Hyphomonas johnsonii MHS-2]